MVTKFLAPDASITGYVPTEAEVDDIRDWFERYDAHSATGRLEQMAAMADFPINLVTDGSKGDAWSGQWNREEFLAVMAKAVGDGSQEMVFTSTRVPHFLTAAMVIVFTDATVRAAGQSHRMRYADILVKKDGRWLFQTMAQGGWADMLTAG